jgi:shikimate dehydrogenase
MITRRPRLVGLLGHRISGSLSPRMQNAAFAARGLDWSYVPVDVAPDEFADAVLELAGGDYAGLNVTAPYKLAAAALAESDAPSVNTLVFDDGLIRGFSTDAAVLDGLAAERPVVLGDGGASVAFQAALPAAQVYAPRGEWPPDVNGADLVVNATSARDDVLVELVPGQTLLDLPYPETATARAARASGATVVCGLEVLVAQGVAGFELWTGAPAPVEVMRRAVGLPA